LHLPFPLADLALLLSGYKGRVVVAWHSDVVRQKLMLKFYKPLMKRLLKRADAILVATQAHIDSSPYLREYREKCVIVPYGIDPAAYENRPHQTPLQDRLHDKSAKKILFTGRLVYYKGADVLLEAFAKVKSNAELFLAGTGVLEPELKAAAAALGIEKRVHFLGRRMTPELRDMFADCDIFVLPSVANSEAFGIVQLEAMFYGKPVINTALPTGVPLVSLHGETGLTVPPSDADALAAAMDRLLSDDALREQYGKAARERVLKEFLLDTVMKKTRDVLLPQGSEKQPKRR
ncbi:MAG: glycosyltransferase, partial [Oscillospiraceae bacterium]|nr:glycosyltransferase [Oscillospiraceae bacterium]